MNIQQLRNATLLAKHLHFTKAAEEANIVQPALSRQIIELERNLGIKLFERNKRKVELTPAGAYYIKEVEQVLAELQEIQSHASEIQNQGPGEIRIGFTYSFMQTILPEVLKKIKTLKPAVKTILREVNNYEQFQALLNRQLDISFATNPIIPPNLKGKKLISSNFVILLPKGHSVNQDNYVKFSQFKDEEFIFPPASDGSNYLRILKSICQDAGFTPKITHITGSATTSFKLVEAGMGVCIEPKSSLQNADVPLNVIELTDIPQKSELTMIWTERFELENPELYRALGNPKYY